MNPAPPKMTTDRKSRSFPLPSDLRRFESIEPLAVNLFWIMKDELPYVLTDIGLEQQRTAGVVGAPRQFGSIKPHLDAFLLHSIGAFFISKEQCKKIKPRRF